MQGKRFEYQVLFHPFDHARPDQIPPHELARAEAFANPYLRVRPEVPERESLVRTDGENLVHAEVARAGPVQPATPLPPPPRPAPRRAPAPPPPRAPTKNRSLASSSARKVPCGTTSWTRVSRHASGSAP